MNINEIIIVEGKEDTRRLKEIFPSIDTIETNGSAIDDNKIEIIRKAKDLRGVIIFTDPDFPGIKIRNIINSNIPNCKNAYISKKDGIDHRKHKVGIEHASDEVIKSALNKVMTLDNLVESDIDKVDLIRLGLIGSSKSKKIRDYVCESLGIGHCNGKQILSRLHMFKITLQELRELIYLKEEGN